MEELKILDEVLTQLKDKTEKEPLMKEDILWYANRLFETSNRNKRTIMEKLIKDGYAARLDIEGIDKYFITFEGLIFIKKGGYSNQHKKESKTKFILSFQTWLIVIGTVLAGIYGIFEMFKFFFCNP